MKQQFSLVVFVLLHGMTIAQFPCGKSVLPVRDSKTHMCNIKTNNQCKKVMLLVTGFATANGYGASISTSNTGKSPVTECYIQTRKDQSTLTCLERYLDNSSKKSGEKYQLILGARADVESVLISVSRRMVRVSVNKHSTSAYPSKKNAALNKIEKIPYTYEAVFPLREATGFCSVDDVYYKANGAKKGNKSGSGYIVSAYYALF